METTKELFNKIVLDIKDIEIIYFDRLNIPEQWKVIMMKLLNLFF